MTAGWLALDFECEAAYTTTHASAGFQARPASAGPKRTPKKSPKKKPRPASAPSSRRKQVEMPIWVPRPKTPGHVGRLRRRLRRAVSESNEAFEKFVRRQHDRIDTTFAPKAVALDVKHREERNFLEEWHRAAARSPLGNLNDPAKVPTFSHFGDRVPIPGLRKRAPWDGERRVRTVANPSGNS